MANGYTTLNIASANLADEVLVNRKGTTSRQAIDLLAMQIWARVGGPAHQTQSALFADLDWAEGTLGTVWGDEDEALLGIYRKLDIAEAGSWERIGDLPVGVASTARIADAVEAEALKRHEADLAITAALLAAGSVFEDVEAGMTAVADGSTFIVAAPDGEGIVIYRRDGSEAIELSTLRANAALAREWALAAQLGADQAALFDGFRVDSLSSLLENTALTYTAGQPGTVVAGNRGYASEEGTPIIVLPQVATQWDFITAHGVKINRTGNLGARSVYAAALLAIKLSDGQFGFMGSELYQKSDTAIGVHSCTNDLGVDGLVPAHGRATPWHFGGNSDDLDFDNTAAVQAAFDWARLGWNAAASCWERYVDLGGKRWLTTYPINATGIRQPRFAYGNGTLYGTFTGIGGVLEAYGTNNPHIFGILIVGAPEERENCPFYGYAHGRQDDNPLAPSNPPIAPSHAKHLETYGCFSRAAELNLGSEVTRTTGHLLNKAVQTTSCVVACFGDQKHAVRRWGVPVTSVFTDLPAVEDGAFSNILHDYSGCELKASAFWNATITGITNGNPAVVSFTTANSFQMDRIIEGDIAYLTSVSGMTQVNAGSYAVKNLVKSGLTGTFELYQGAVPIDASGYGIFTGTAGAWRRTGDAFVCGSVRGVNISNEAYLLAYGGEPIVIYADGGGANDIKFSGQTENQCNQIVRIITEPGSTTSIIGMKLDLMSASQVMKRVFLTEGDGTVSITDFELDVKTHATDFDLVQGGPANVTFKGAKLSAPVNINTSGADSFSGHIRKFSGTEINRFVGGVETDYLNLTTPSSALSATGLRADAASGGQLYARGPTWTAERMLLTAGKATSAQLLNAASDVNTKGKAQGTVVLDTTLDHYVRANNSAPTGTWKALGSNTIVHTPT